MSTPESSPQHAATASDVQQELQAARDALGEFAYVVSHDLRAQLRHIISYSSLLKEDLGAQLQGEPAQFLQVITDAAQLMGRQIDGLKEWAQLDRVALQPMTVDTLALLQEVQHSMDAANPQRELMWQIDGPLPPIRGDGGLLRQLFAHILGNAAKFTARTPVAQIAVRAEVAEPGWVTLLVQDNGVGFDPARKDKLGHVFQRLHHARDFEGLGLGLALSQKIVQRHGGKLQLDAIPQKGCWVRLTLPAA
jgi:light-regulated signal transduction histidine kinase (bacteriophytochrome)